MRYMLLIYTPESAEPAPGTPEHTQMYQDYGAFTQEVNVNGTFKAGEPLQPIATATTVRVRDGRTQVTDGPFAETREQLGGYYILDCADLDQAVALAAKIPGARFGSIEVRPIMEMG